MQVWDLLEIVRHEGQKVEDFLLNGLFGRHFLDWLLIQVHENATSLLSLRWLFCCLVMLIKEGHVDSGAFLHSAQLLSQLFLLNRPEILAILDNLLRLVFAFLTNKFKGLNSSISELLVRVGKAILN